MSRKYKKGELNAGNVSKFPELYDMLHSNFSQDISYYIELSQICEELLEIGIGTGRIAIPLAKAGKIVYGLDNSDEMLAHLQQKISKENQIVKSRIKITKGDMCNFDLKKKFKLICVPYMTLNYLLSIEAQIKCLTCLYSHLKKGGLLVLELISFYPAWFLDDKIPRLVFREQNKFNNEITDIYRIVRFDASNQILEHDRIYKWYNNKGSLIKEQIVFFKNRFMFFGEIQLLLNKIGFSIKSIHGDYNKSAYSKESQIILIIATRL